MSSGHFTTIKRKVRTSVLIRNWKVIVCCFNNNS